MQEGRPPAHFFELKPAHFFEKRAGPNLHTFLKNVQILPKSVQKNLHTFLRVNVP